MIGRAHIAGMSRRKEPGLVWRTVLAVPRLVLPVLFLLIAGAACVIYSNASALGLGSFAGRPISVGLALLPLTFFVVHMTNRRYGASYAFAQVIIAWAIGMFALPSLLPMMSPAPDTRVVAGFGTALFIAQLVSVFVFDRLRGPAWWKAPLIASLVGGLLFCLIAFPTAFAGTELNWSRDMFEFTELAVGASIVLLIPYGLLRSLVPPRSGFGGY
jgi:uncharacterized PurR-regulated membrane protein YhhQ (DUF165 family)